MASYAKIVKDDGKENENTNTNTVKRSNLLGHDGSVHHHRKVARFLLLSLWCLVVFGQDYMDFVNEGGFAWL
jgi:hypothetical protein